MCELLIKYISLFPTREKVGALFRDSLHTQYRSAGKTKAQLRATSKKQQVMRQQDIRPDELLLSSFGSFDFDIYY
jgi:hypothetical protein